MHIVEFKDIVNWSPVHLTGWGIHYRPELPLVRLGDILVRCKDKVRIQPDEVYTRVTLKKNYGGIVLRDKKQGEEIGRKLQYRIKGGQLLVSKIDVSNGAVGIVPKDLTGSVVTENFWIYEVSENSSTLLEYIALILSTSVFKSLASEYSNGSTGRQYMQEKVFLDQYVPMPELALQRRLVNKYRRANTRGLKMKEESLLKERELQDRLFSMLGIVQSKESLIEGQLHFFSSSELDEWSFDKLKTESFWTGTEYAGYHIGEHPDMFTLIQRGVSPDYTTSTGKGMLNQKCVRWYDLDLQYMKTVTESSLVSCDRQSFTCRGDMLINSTGDGTLGRSAVVRKASECGRLYDSHVILLRLSHETVDSEYLCFLFNSQYVQSQISQLKSAVATSQTELGVENLRKVRVILPPLSKQKVIARELNNIRKRIRTQSDIDKLITRAREEFEQAIIVAE